MDGVKAYEEKFNQKTVNVLKNNTEKPYLEGFYYFINNHLSYSSTYDYVNYILNFMNFINKSPEELTLDDYTKYLSSLRNKTSSYQISVYSALKKFSTYLLANGKNTLNPMQYIKRPKAVESKETKTKRENGFLKEDEIKTYLETIEYGAGTSRAVARQEEWKERDKLIAYIFLATGMRCSALFKLNVENIDYINKKLNTMEKRDKIVEYPMSEELMECISAWLKKRQSLLQGKDEDALFISNQRTRMDQSSIYRVVQKFAENIPDKNITPHKLRATYGSCIFNETKNLYLTQKCMGHSNPKTTEIYIRGQEDATKETGLQIMSKNLKF